MCFVLCVPAKNTKKYRSNPLNPFPFPVAFLDYLFLFPLPLLYEHWLALGISPRLIGVIISWLGSPGFPFSPRYHNRKTHFSLDVVCCSRCVVVVHFLVVVVVDVAAAVLVVDVVVVRARCCCSDFQVVVSA